SRALAWRPLRYTGRISYGLYLYHWPLFLVLNQARTGLSGPALLGLRFGATFVAARLSARFIEVPIRRGRVFWGRPRRGARRPARAPVPLLRGGGPLAAWAAVRPPPPPPGPPPSAPLAPPAAASSPAPAGVDAAHPARALLIGDSMALTLGKGLGVAAST